MPNLKVDVETLREAIWGDVEDFELIGDAEAIDERRWYIVYKQIVKHVPTGKFYSIEYNKGTGDEGERPFEHEIGDVAIPEVEPYEVTVTKYRPVK